MLMATEPIAMHGLSSSLLNHAEETMVSRNLACNSQFAETVHRKYTTIDILQIVRGSKNIYGCMVVLCITQGHYH